MLFWGREEPHWDSGSVDEMESNDVGWASMGIVHVFQGKKNVGSALVPGLPPPHPCIFFIAHCRVGSKFRSLKKRKVGNYIVYNITFNSSSKKTPSLGQNGVKYSTLFHPHMAR